MTRASTEQLPPAFSRVVLIRGDCEFTVQDVLAYAWFLGELQDPWTQLMNGIACQQSAAKLDLEPDDEMLNSMSEEFRYARDLLTTEETERWLHARDLTEDDFNRFLVRRYWQNNPPESEGTKGPQDYGTTGPQDQRERSETTEYLTASAELRELLRIDLLFTGKFDELARALSWRLAAGAELNKTEPNADLAKDERARFFERTGLDELSLPEALTHLNRTPAWLEGCLELEIGYRQASESVVSDQARARTLASMRLPLTHIKFQILTLGSKEAAQEALFCLTEDQLSPEQLATECGVSWEDQEMFLGDLQPDLQQEFFSAAPGEVLGPKPAEDAFVVVRLVAKTEPSLADDQVRARLDQRLMESHFSEISSKHIRWMLGEPQRQ
jgi:hypothetical protein